MLLVGRRIVSLTALKVADAQRAAVRISGSDQDAAHCARVAMTRMVDAGCPPWDFFELRVLVDCDLEGTPLMLHRHAPVWSSAGAVHRVLVTAADSHRSALASATFSAVRLTMRRLDQEHACGPEASIYQCQLYLSLIHI